MATDLLRDLGPVFLGSRLKRLAEAMQGGAAQVLADVGLPVQPTHMPLLAALDRGPLTVGQLADTVGSSQPGVTRGAGQLIALGLVEAERGDDQRQKTLSLTPAGKAAMARSRLLVWPRVGEAVRELCGGDPEGFLARIGAIEDALADASLNERVAAIAPPALTIRDYRDDLADAFLAINAEWIEAMYRMEPADREVLENPRKHVIDPGGAILFVEAPGLGIVGTCALRNSGDGAFELTKMGVRESARGLKAGEFLLAATIDRAQAMGVETLYLLSNRRAAAAIHLYEKLGFRHDAEIMATYGARYARCDVAMRYVGRRH